MYVLAWSVVFKLTIYPGSSSQRFNGWPQISSDTSLRTSHSVGNVLLSAFVGCSSCLFVGIIHVE